MLHCSHGVTARHLVRTACLPAEQRLAAPSTAKTTVRRQTGKVTLEYQPILQQHLRLAWTAAYCDLQPLIVGRLTVVPFPYTASTGRGTAKVGFLQRRGVQQGVERAVGCKDGGRWHDSVGRQLPGGWRGAVAAHRVQLRHQGESCAAAVHLLAEPNGPAAFEPNLLGSQCRTSRRHRKWTRRTLHCSIR